MVLGDGLEANQYGHLRYAGHGGQCSCGLPNTLFEDRLLTGVADSPAISTPYVTSE